MLVCGNVLYKMTTLIIFGQLSLGNLSKAFWKSNTISQIRIVHMASNSFKDKLMIKDSTLHVCSSLIEHIH